jgi:3-oxoacyl-[acyl-carrier protein] reductase
MIDPGLEGKVALVTSANHGIGAAIAEALAAQGVKTFLSFYYEPNPYTEEELTKANEAGRGGDALYRALQHTPVEEVVERIRGLGGVAAATEADLSDPESVPRLFGAAESTLGPVDILVNNHAYCPLVETFDPNVEAPPHATADDLLQKSDKRTGHLPTVAGINAAFEVNARGTVLTMVEYVRRYLDRGAESGRIINISTDAAHAHPGQVSYAASKHAIESYSRSAAYELGKYGITVNIVSPGVTQTGYVTPESEAKIAPHTPLRRLGEPRDIADVVVFMASEQARWVTGQLLYAGGGWRMHQ